MVWSDPYIAGLVDRLTAEQARVIDARPPGAVITGDVDRALAQIVWSELVPSVLVEVPREEAAYLRWLCGWEPHAIAVVVGLIRRAHRNGAEACRVVMPS